MYSLNVNEKTPPIIPGKTLAAFLSKTALLNYHCPSWPPARLDSKWSGACHKSHLPSKERDISATRKNVAGLERISRRAPKHIGQRQGHRGGCCAVTVTGQSVIFSWNFRCGSVYKFQYVIPHGPHIASIWEQWVATKVSQRATLEKQLHTCSCIKNKVTGDILKRCTGTENFCYAYHKVQHPFAAVPWVYDYLPIQT